MLTKTKIALAVALVAGSASVASAQGFDPNPANRYPSYSAPGGMAQPYIGTGVPLAQRRVAERRRAALRAQGLQSAPVRLQQGRTAARRSPCAGVRQLRRAAGRGRRRPAGSRVLALCGRRQLTR